ncbi:GTPase [Duganella fentianensis]|uniref:GTPase n=1 Tax=Duganella fentianensis TaxID=2692177 RepID=UPI0032B21ABC
MSAALNYPYLLAAHMICIDGQLHQQELLFLKTLANNVGVDDATKEAAELILAQADQHLTLQSVIHAITPDNRTQALSLAALAAQLDGVLDRTEQRLLDELRQKWQIADSAYKHIEQLAIQEAQRLIASLQTVPQEEVSTAAKLLSKLDTLLGRGIVDRVVDTLASGTIKKSIQDYRIEALLSGPKYDGAIEACRDVGMKDIEVADTCLQVSTKVLQDIDATLERKIKEMQDALGDKLAQSGREALHSMKSDRATIVHLINHELQEIQELQIKKRRAMNFYTIAFMGRSKAGKSTLHAVVTAGGWDQIGVGRQNTTRLNRVYEWHNIRIIDTPGIATPGGEELEKVAASIIDEADLICFVVTNNNQQASEFEFLKRLREKGKPLLVLLNVKENLEHPVRLKRFLERPDQSFSLDKDQLGGHIDRIRRDAETYYGTSHFPIIPVQLLAAQIAQQQPEHEHAQALMKASRLQDFLDSVRLSLLDEGLLRRSQNLLGSTVADIERPSQQLKERAAFYLDFAKNIHTRADESTVRLEKAVEFHARQLEHDLRAVFAALLHEVPDFAEDHWDDSESRLNDSWAEKLERFGMEQKIQAIQENAVNAFSNDIKDLLEEVSQEINLHRKFSFAAGKLDEQDSSVWLQKTLQWGSGLASLGLGVMALANLWNPGGWVMAGVAIIGMLASLFESKASKRRKAVAKISTSLETQIEKQQEKIVGAAIKQFQEQCQDGATVVQDYFRVSAEGLAFVGKTLTHGVELLEAQRDILNIHFAARVIDFAGKAPSESSAQAVRNQISAVRRKVGERIDIVPTPKLRAPKNLGIVEPIIQEKITLQKADI